MTALRRACLYLLLLSSLTVGQLAGLLSPATQQAAAFDTFVSFQAGTATTTNDGLVGDGLTLRNRFPGAGTTICTAEGCDGLSPGELGESVGIQVSKVEGAPTIGYAYMDIADSYRSGYTYASLQVEYFDKGTGQFVIQYNTPITDSSSLASPGRSTLNKAYLSDSRTWKTYTFYLYNTSFANDAEPSSPGLATFAWADFRVAFSGGDGSYRLVFRKATVTRSNADDLRPRLESRTDPLVFQAPDSQTGLYLVPAGAGRVTANSSFGRDAIQVSSDNKAFFDVDNTYLYQGKDLNGASHAYAALEISYYDRGFGSFYVLYDSASDAARSLGPFLLLNSNSWITKTIYLTNVYFGNRTVGDYADLRLDFLAPTPDPTGYRLVFDRLTLQRLDTDPTDFSQATSVYFQSPGTERGLQLVNTAGDLTSPVLITDTLGITRTATQVSSGGLAFFNVSDTYIYQGNYKDATIQVTYFDRGRGFFYLKFDSSSPLAASTTEQAAWESINGLGEESPNDIVYLTDSRTWKTHTFTLSNVYFGNRQLLGLADLVVVYPVALANSTTANQGYLLAISQAMVTRSASPIDRAGQLEGNFTGFGPAFVWARLAGYPAGTADLGGRNEQGHGLWQNETASATTSATKGNKQCRLNSPGGAIYFDVNDGYIKNGNAYNVYVTVEYYDEGTNPFTIQYDSTTAAGTNAEQVARTGSNSWKRYTFYLTDAYFGNRLDGATDFRIVNTAKDLCVAGVYVQRAIGPYVQPRNQDFSAIRSFERTSPVVATYYFMAFDSYYPSLWPTSYVTPTDSLSAAGYPADYGWRSPDSLRKDVSDMGTAKIDVALVWYQGATLEASRNGIQAVRNLVQAIDAVTSTLKLGLFLDPTHLKSESVAKDKDALVDLTTTTGKALLFKLVEDFYSLVPPRLWASYLGRPIIVVYPPQGFATDHDSTTLQFLSDRFLQSFGVRPYVIADIAWTRRSSDNSTIDAPRDETFGWGAALSPSNHFWNDTASVGPGFKDDTREKARENGAYYSRSWREIIQKGTHLALVETWNYWAEGSGIADSLQYARQYINATAELAQTYKTASYSNTTTVSAILGATNTSSGLYQDEMSTAATTPVTIGGQTGRKAGGDNMFFSVHDSFIFKTYYPVDIAVEYYDGNSASGGTDWFAIQYDAAGGIYYPPSVTEDTLVDIIELKGGNTKTWKTKTFHFTDAYFGNRQDNRNDFVLKSPGGLVVRQVTVTRPAILSLPNKVYVPFAAKGTSGW